MEAERCKRLHIVDPDSDYWDSAIRLFKSAEIHTTHHSAGEAFLSDVSSKAAGCLVTELRLPGMGGLELLEHVARMPIPPAVIVVAASAEVATAVRALHLGALTLLEKPVSAVVVLSLVREGIGVGNKRRMRQARRLRTLQKIGDLTGEEQDIVDLVIGGVTNKAIARELTIGLRTVESRCRRILEKTGARSNLELVAMVVEARTQLECMAERNLQLGYRN